MPTPAPRLHAAGLRREIARLLDRLGVPDDDTSPRALAVVLAVRDGLDPRTALDRLGIDTTPLDAPPPPEPVPFHVLPPRARYRHNGFSWTKASLDDLFVLEPDPSVRRRVVEAYARASRGGRGAANAYAEDVDAPGGVLAAHFHAEAAILPSPRDVGRHETGAAA